MTNFLKFPETLIGYEKSFLILDSLKKPESHFKSLRYSQTLAKNLLNKMRKILDVDTGWSKFLHHSSPKYTIWFKMEFRRNYIKNIHQMHSF